MKCRVMFHDKCSSFICAPLDWQLCFSQDLINNSFRPCFCSFFCKFHQTLSYREGVFAESGTENYKWRTYYWLTSPGSKDCFPLLGNICTWKICKYSWQIRLFLPLQSHLFVMMFHMLQWHGLNLSHLFFKTNDLLFWYSYSISFLNY